MCVPSRHLPPFWPGFIGCLVWMAVAGILIYTN